MKKFDIDYDFGGQKSKFTIYIGTPQDGHHPLQFQSKWLSDERGGTIPDAVMDAVKQLYDLSKKIMYRLKICVFMLLVLLKKLKPQVTMKMRQKERIMMMKIIKQNKHKLSACGSRCHPVAALPPWIPSHLSYANEMSVAIQKK